MVMASSDGQTSVTYLTTTTYEIRYHYSLYLDKFNHNWSLHTPRAPGQTASQSEPLERASLLPGLSPGYVWHIAIQLLFA